MRPMWSGSLSFGLVNIPVRLYTATQTTRPDLDLLHRNDFSRIRYAKVCKYEGVEVPEEEIVRGAEQEDGQYVVLENDELASINRARSKTLEILGFVDQEQIDSIYFEKPYYLEPDKGAVKAYSLLTETMRKANRNAIVRYVLRNREHIGVIKARGNLLVLNQLRFNEEIREPADLNLPEDAQADEQELSLANTLIEKLATEFKPESYRDNYADQLNQLIANKAAGRVPIEEGEEPEPTSVVDLMETLRKSLEQEAEKAA